MSHLLPHLWVQRNLGAPAAVLYAAGRATWDWLQQCEMQNLTSTVSVTFTLSDMSHSQCCSTCPHPGRVVYSEDSSMRLLGTVQLDIHLYSQLRLARVNGLGKG